MKYKLLLLALFIMSITTAKSQTELIFGAEQQPLDTSHILVAYFSATGTTERVAQQLSQLSGGRLWKIEPLEPYTEADLNWRDENSRSSKEMRDTFWRTTIKMCTDIRQYTVIYLGFPIWWGMPPRIIQSWIENNYFDGKVIIPFATSGSSPIEPAVDFLRRRYPEIHFENGVLLNNPSEDQLKTLLTR